MMGVRGLFAAMPVSPPNNGSNSSPASKSKNHPGIRALGYLERVNANEKSAFPARYLSQFDSRQEGGFGRDHFTDAERRPVMEQARDGGQAQMSRAAAQRE